MNKDREVTYAEAYDFFEKHCASVEVFRNQKLERFYFPKPPVCEFLTSDMRNAIMFSIKRNSPAEKITDLFNYTDAVQFD